MSRATFLKLLAQHLYPVLRDEGFVGTGQTLRRIAGPVVHVFNVQGARAGNECYLNLGAHMAFLPTEGDAHVEPEALEESHCVFRSRMDPPTGSEFGWAYCKTAEESALNVAFIVSEWYGPGRAFFARYARYPDSFEQLLAGTDPDQVSMRAALHLARIAAHLGQTERAQVFVQVGLAKAPERATRLRADLTKVLEA